MSSVFSICRCREILSNGLRWVVMSGLLLVTTCAPGQMIDLNGNGLSDIWEWTYNAYGINPQADSDGDGFANWQEAIAGTDPLSSNSYPHIPLFFSTPTNFTVTIPSQPGKVYTVYGITNWYNDTYQVETNMEA